MMGEIAAIKRTLIAHPNTLLQLSQIDGIAEQIQLLQRSNNSAQQGSDPQLASAQTRSGLEKLESKLSELKQIVLDSAMRNKALAKASDQSAQIFTALAITCCIAVCPTFALYFTQNLVRRLNVLAENSDRFSRGDSLIDTESGADEIGQLDEMFRAMAGKIKEEELAKKEFVAMINHDLRTPLNSIQATLTLLGQGVYGSLSTAGVRKAQQAEVLTDELLGLVNQLLELDKIRSGHLNLTLKPVDINSVIAAASSAVNGFAEFKSVRIEVGDVSVLTQCENVPLRLEARSVNRSFQVLADEQRLTQVMINLLSNAIKHGPDNSTVTVTVKEVDSSQLEISVHDSGLPIEAELRETIFDRFIQGTGFSTGRLDGTGLGLSICKEIISGHHGTIGLTVDEAGGNTFWFRIRSVQQTKALEPARTEA